MGFSAESLSGLKIEILKVFDFRVRVFPNPVIQKMIAFESRGMRMSLIFPFSPTPW
jgi:hypothetical protein